MTAHDAYLLTIGAELGYAMTMTAWLIARLPRRTAAERAARRAARRVERGEVSDVRD